MKISYRRRLMPAKALLLLNLLALGCTDTLGPVDLGGTWAADFIVPGASLVLNLSQTDGLVEGGGTYAIEAGHGGKLQVSGTYTRPRIVLDITYDDGRAETFSGTAPGSRHMSGTVTDNAGNMFARSFTRQ
jgi:hypothetical protein